MTVTALAQAQQLLSKAFTGGVATTVGTGTLALSLGGTSFNVTIDGTDNTLAGIAAAINSATGNPGIAATVLQGTDGAHLVLSSSLTGAANTIQVTETDAGNGLAALTYGTGNTGNYTQEAAPQDAAFSIAGVDYTSPSNTVTDALSGVTLNLLAPYRRRQQRHPERQQRHQYDRKQHQCLRDCLQHAGEAIQPLGSYDASTNTAGPMLGNALLSGTTNQIQQALYSVVNTGSSTYNSLASIGITTNSDGTPERQQRHAEQCAGDQFQRREPAVQRQRRRRHDAQQPDHRRAGFDRRDSLRRAAHW